MKLSNIKSHTSFLLSLRPHPHQQKCRSNIVEAIGNNADATLSKWKCWMWQEEQFFRHSRMLLRQSRLLLRHCCHLWQQCQTSFRWNFILLTKSKQIEHVQFVSTLSKWQIFTKNLFDIVAKNGNNVKATIDFVETIVQLVAFDNAASTLSLRQCCWYGKARSKTTSHKNKTRQSYTATSSPVAHWARAAHARHHVTSTSP